MAEGLENIKIYSLDEYKTILDMFMSERKGSTSIVVTPENLYSVLLTLANSTHFKRGGGTTTIDSNAPSNDDGFDDDVYIDKLHGIFYVKVGGVWEITLDLSGALAGGFNQIVGTIDASTNPNYPAAFQGNGFRIIDSGKIGGVNGVDVEVGDVVFNLVDSAGGTHIAVGSEFYILQANLTFATETFAGYSELATQAEMDLGLDDTRTATPLKVKETLKTYTYSQDIGDTFLTVFSIAHNLNNKFNHVMVIDNVTDEQVYPNVDYLNNNTTVITFLKPPLLNEYRVIVKSL